MSEKTVIVPDDSSWRFKWLVLDVPCMKQLCLNGKSFRCVSGLPETSEIRVVLFDKETNCWELLVEDESYPRVRDGDDIPQLPPLKFQRIAST